MVDPLFAICYSRNAANPTLPNYFWVLRVFVVVVGSATPI